MTSQKGSKSPMHDVVLSRLGRSVGLYADLAAEIPETALQKTLPGLPSNTVGEQLWCVVGARESYSRAIVAGQWQGFSCSLSSDQCRVQAEVAAALAQSGANLLATVTQVDAPSVEQNQSILDVLEHEASHQGQLIRYLYALRLSIPESWKVRYALR